MHFPSSSTKKVFSYNKIIGLVQQQDKMVVRSAHTIYPYSLGTATPEWACPIERTLQYSHNEHSVIQADRQI